MLQAVLVSISPYSTTSNVWTTIRKYFREKKTFLQSTGLYSVSSISSSFLFCCCCC